MAAGDFLFKLTCSGLFVTARASGAWLTASMFKGYNDAQEYQVRRKRTRKEAEEFELATTSRRAIGDLFFSTSTTSKQKHQTANTPARLQRSSRPSLRSQDLLIVSIFSFF